MEEPLREADFLLARALRTDRARLHADPPALTPAAARRFLGWVERRARREPAAYVLGRAEFWSLEFRVTPAVLVPRPETEHLVEAALRALAGTAAPRVADVGTGSGCVAVALARERPDARVVATDRSAAALAVARGNARAHAVAGRVRFVRADLLEGLRGPFDLVLSNPPYVGDGEEVAPEVLHEPREAVFAGPDPVAVYRSLAAGAARLLRPGGTLAVEVTPERAGAVAATFREAGMIPALPILDLAGHARVLMARPGS